MKEHTYCNPLPYVDGKRHTNPDPFILRWCGDYYCYATDHNGVKVSVSHDLTLWEDCGFALTESNYEEYWAPAVLYENGVFYLYYSNVPRGEGDCHQEFLKVATATNPLGPFQWQQTFFDKFSIDAHPIYWNGKRYLFYSVNDWIGTDEKIAGTGILVDELVTPTQLRGEPKAVVMPTLEQEIYERNRFNDGRDWYTIEGAATVCRDNRCWVLYSGNAFVNTDYFVGSAVASSRDDFMEMEWKKYPSDHEWHPLLRKNNDVEGTGHNTVTKAPNLVDEWIVYHGRNAHEELIQGVEQREMRMDRLYFHGDEVSCQGPTAAPQPAPELPHVKLGQQTIVQPTYIPVEVECYVAEYWISAKPQHTGCHYSVTLTHQDERNYIALSLHSGRNTLVVTEVTETGRHMILQEKLPANYQFAAPHLIRVEKNGQCYQIILDECQHYEVVSVHCLDGKSVGIIPHFTELMLHSFSVTYITHQR